MHALIPVKSLHDAKSRLAKTFSVQQRHEIVLAMLDHVLTVLTASSVIKHISVVTPDSEVVEYVKKFAVSLISEEKVGYNQSLTYAAQKENQNEKLLSLPADLPLLTIQDIQSLHNLSQKYEVVLAPSKDNGTNAVLTSFPLQIPYLFGKNSFEKYKNELQKRKLRLGIYQSKTIAFDIDTPDDVEVYKQTTGKNHI